ncbi:MAG TPA: phosphotransferase family protein, partial [Rhodospirillaceae bacterium]|nr:phosphotransferase family protein [Rhodospirillaceae bacterium]
MSTADRTYSRTDLVVPVLEQHCFDDTALVTWMTTNIDGFEGPIELAQFQGG